MFSVPTGDHKSTHLDTVVVMENFLTHISFGVKVSDDIISGLKWFLRVKGCFIEDSLRFTYER